ncbi:MAG: MBL fold metallo-hydrolase [Acidobacteriota bacterium]
MTSLKVTVLGCGTSTGVPLIGCTCVVCTSEDPKNHRLRPGLALEFEGRTVLVDTPPDLRQQAIEHRIDRVDAVLYTHAHADHVLGFDDLRAFTMRHGGEIPIYGARETLDRLYGWFRYAFDGNATTPGTSRPRLVAREIQGVFWPVEGLEVEPIEVWHGPLSVLAFRIGRFAYATDCNYIPDAAIERLRGVDVLILDGLRYRPHSTHFAIAESIEVAARIGAARTYLTHLSHEVDYTAPAIDMPATVEFAYDGLVLEL